MQINFITPTLLSPIDISSMGDSSKRTDDSKIGSFDSGLKYAIALLLRNNVDITIEVYKESTDKEEQSYSYLYEPFIRNEECDYTNKCKELISFHVTKTPCGNSYVEPWGTTEESDIHTGFALQLGHNWELWQAWRELYSNMLDEGGYYTNDSDSYSLDINGTKITLTFDEHNLFYQVWLDRDKYILNSKNHEVYLPIKDNYDNIKGYIFESPDGHLRIYKKGILVYENVNEKSFFNFNSEFGEIDERRMLNDYWSVLSELTGYLQYTNDNTLASFIIREEEYLDKNDVLNKVSFYSPNNFLVKYFEDKFEYCTPHTFKDLEKNIKCHKLYNSSGKVLRSIGDDMWTYSKNVTIKSTPTEVICTIFNQTKESIKDQIERIYDIHIECDIKQASIFGQKSIEDKYNKCIIIDKEFDVDADFAEFLVSYFSLVGKKNVLLDLAEFTKQKIKK
jgi:hypothetical protein